MKKKKPLLGAVDEAREQELLNIFEQLGKTPRAELVRIGNAINTHEWCESLPNKPDGWERMSVHEKDAWARPIIHYISVHVGEKALLRYYHKTEFGETDQEFEDWWDSYSRRSSIEQQKEFYHCYYRGRRGDHKRYYCGLFVEAILFFALGLLAAFFLR